MTKTLIKQYVYYGDNNASNTPGLNKNNLVSGDIFAGKSIIQLGIQGYPGLKFYLNGAKDIRDNGVIIGPTGLYELNVNKESTITNLRFNESSLDNNSLIVHGGLIIDILYVQED